MRRLLLICVKGPKLLGFVREMLYGTAFLDAC